MTQKGDAPSQFDAKITARKIEAESYESGSRYKTGEGQREGLDVQSNSRLEGAFPFQIFPKTIH